MPLFIMGRELPKQTNIVCTGCSHGTRDEDMYVQMKGYRGRSDTARQKIVRHNQLALAVENYLHEHLNSCPDEIQVFLYHEIADAIGAKVKEIRETLSHRGGYNGVTLGKPRDLDTA